MDNLARGSGGGNSAAGDIKDTPPAGTDSGNGKLNRVKDLITIELDISTGGFSVSKDEKAESKTADPPKADDKISVDGKAGLLNDDNLTRLRRRRTQR